MYEPVNGVDVCVRVYPDEDGLGVGLQVPRHGSQPNCNNVII